MTEIREKLKELGFISYESDNAVVFEYRNEDTGATVWITSGDNCRFKVERECKSYEMGFDGWGRYTAFAGNISSLEDLDAILRSCYVYSDMGLKSKRISI